MTKSNAPIIGDVRFLKYGADAPDESRFKGKISTESLIGFFEYTEQEEKNVVSLVIHLIKTNIHFLLWDG